MSEDVSRLVAEPRKNRRQAREIDPPEVFFAAWAFDIPIPAYLEAFDIRWRHFRKRNDEGKSIWIGAWSQGDPPRYAFTAGDAFHAPAGARLLPWGHAGRTHVVQIIATAEASLRVRILRATGEAAVDAVEERDLAVDAFVRMLREGM